jgi:hypothetical protein
MFDFPDAAVSIFNENSPPRISTLIELEWHRYSALIGKPSGVLS